MQVLRDNKESLMAVLEAFVYDPLINWRLMQTDVEGRRAEGDKSSHCFACSGNSDVQKLIPTELRSSRVLQLIPKDQHENSKLMKTIYSMVRPLLFI